ncbi:MAG: hypothetical protein AAF790_02330 [Planctomycetota bacterium]
MDDVKKKVLLDLFVSPWTVAPVVAGLSAWLLSWGVDGSTTLNLLGLAGVLTGIGVQASRLVFGLEKITERAHGYLTEKEHAEREAELDRLAARLRRDEDPRTQQCLDRLRKLREVFEAEPPAGHAAQSIKGQVDRLFEASVRQLERAYTLWERAQRLPAGTRGPLLKERAAAVNEVVLSANHLTRTVEQFHAFQVKDSDDELAKLREELDATIEVARRADELIGSLDGPSIYDESEFDPARHGADQGE